MKSEMLNNKARAERRSRYHF